MRLAIRRAAATRKWPEPQAGSQTVRSSSAATRLFGRAVRAGLVEQGVERGVEQALDQRGGRVVGAGLLALVAGQCLQRVGELLGVVARDQFQQGLVDAAEFLGAEVAEVDPPPGAAVAGLDQGQRADRAEQRLVGQARAGERLVQRERASVIARGLEDAADAGQGQFGDAAFGAERVEDELRRPRRGRRAVSPRRRRASWRSRAEEKYWSYRSRASRSLRLRRFVGVLGVGCSRAPRSSATNQNSIRYTSRSSARLRSSSLQLAAAEADAQLRVVRVGQEPGAEDGDGLLDAVAELVERPLALVRGEAAPLFQVAGCGAAVALDREAGLVADQVEQHEVGEQLAVEDRLQVELDVGGADQRGRVAQQPQRGAVGQDRPQVGVVPVEQFLQHGLRGAGADVRGLVVQVGAPAEQVDGTCPAWWLTGKLLPSISKLPAVMWWKPSSRSRMRSHRSRVTLAEVAASSPATRCLTSCQISSRYEPGPGGLAAHRLAALQAVGLRAGSGYLRVAGEYPAEQVGGEQAADDLQRAELGHDAPPPGR